MTRTLFAVALALLISLPLAAQQRKAETEQEKLGARHFNEAIQLYTAGSYEECIPLFIATDTLIGATDLVDRTKLRFALGNAFYESGQHASALGYFQWVADQDSTYPYIQFMMAESARRIGKRSEALAYYRSALKQATDSERPSILGRIGELELAAGRLQSSLKALNLAIEANPTPGFLLMRGQVYDRQAQLIDHAEDENFDYERAIRRREITEEQMEQANELRRKAMEDYSQAAEHPDFAGTASDLVERSEIIIENNNQVISEIRYQREDN